MAIYLSENNQQVGPFEDAEILSSLAAGKRSPDDLAWREGMPAWVPLRTLFPHAVNAGPPPLPVTQHVGDDAGIRMLLPVGRSGLAIAAGYLGLFSIIILPAPICLIVSILAIRDIRKHRHDPHPKHGMGRAIFGLVMGLLGTGVVAVGGIAALMDARH